LLIRAIRFQLFMNHFNTYMYRVPCFNFRIEISKNIKSTEKIFIDTL